MNHHKAPRQRLYLWIFMGLLLGIACGPLTSAVTEVALPTATPTAPLPTETAVVVATETPVPPTETPVPTPTPTSPSQLDISGSYNVSGTNQDGSTYAGTATITDAGSNNYDVTWDIGGTIIEGAGILDGDVFIIDDGTFINTYTVLPNGDLDGTWSQRGVEGTGTELLQRVSAGIAAPTPDLAATAVGAQIAMIDAGLREFGLSTNEGHLGWVHDTIVIKVDTYMEKRAEVDYPGLIVANFVVQADITWDSSSGLAGCGFLLRADTDFERGPQYQFAIVRLAGLPLWDIEYHDLGRFQYNLGELLSTDALNDSQHSTNTITIIVEDDKLTAYANGEELGSLRDSTLAEGVVAFLAWQESGETTCEFSNAWLWVLDD